VKPEDKQLFLNLNEVEILGMCILFEASTEPYEGKVAVGSVVLNRVDHPGWGWGNSIHTVIMKPAQFSWLNTKDKQYPKAVETAKKIGIMDVPKLDSCCMIADLLITGEVERNVKAMHYYADYISAPSWAAKMKVEVKIGRHIFLI
jgi:N-acetylmuramoyl-L-alanine amidase